MVHSRPDTVETLSAAIGKVTGFEAVDVVNLEAQGPIFAHGVLCDGWRVFVGDEDKRIDFESDTMSKAWDFAPTYALATRGKVAAFRRWLEERYDIGSSPGEARPSQGKPEVAR
jgi:hypothetical protein